MLCFGYLHTQGTRKKGVCIVLLVSSVRETTKGFVTLCFMLSRIELGQRKEKQNVVVMFVFVSRLAGFE